MELSFATPDLEKICTNARRMQAALGADATKKLKLRIAELAYVEEMAALLEGRGRWGMLTADRAGQWSARLTGNLRLIVEETDDGTVRVVEIVDYH